MAITIKGGTIIPDKAALKKLLSSIKTDPKKKAAYKKSPNTYLANIGLNQDIRRELLLNEPGGKRFAARAKGCTFTCIFTSCPCTNCCLTITL